MATMNTDHIRSIFLLRIAARTEQTEAAIFYTMQAAHRSAADDERYTDTARWVYRQHAIACQVVAAAHADKARRLRDRLDMAVMRSERIARIWPFMVRE